MAQTPKSSVKPTPIAGRLLAIAGWGAVVASLVVTAAVVGGSPDVQKWHDSDTFIFSLASTYAWSPFFWGQDRLGMFFPLVAMPVADPLWNMVSQCVLMSLFGLGAFVLLGWYFTDAKRGAVIGLLIGLAMLFIMDEWRVFQLLIAHSEYLGSFCLALAGMLVLARGRPGAAAPPGPFRVVAGAILILLGCWINITVPILFVPMIVGRWLTGSGPMPPVKVNARDLAPVGNAVPTSSAMALRILRWPFQGQRAAYTWSIIVMAAGMVAVKALAVALNLPKSSTALTPASEWLGGWQRMLDNTMEFLYSLRIWRVFHLRWGLSDEQIRMAKYSVPAFMVVLALARLPFKGGLRALARACCVAAVMAVPAVLFFLLAGTLQHVKEYEYGWRYALPTVILLAAAVASFTVVIIWSWLAAWRGAPAIAAVVALALAMPVLALSWYEHPDEQKVRLAWDQREAWTAVGRMGTLGERCREVIEQRCTHVGGHMWHTWDTVFYTNLLLYRSGSPRRVYGISWRGEEMRRLWRGMPASAIRLGSMEYDWRDGDMYHLQDWHSFPRINPEPVEYTTYLHIHVAR
ncbi:MAG: hypothetical protein ACE15C_04610 [Phycisphaerae bacterium]